MIAFLFAASVLPVQIACTNCNGVGYFEVDCPRCSGAGLVDPPRSTKITRGMIERMSNGKLPCPDCVKGLSRKDKKGSGKKKVTCKVCWGKKKIRR